MAVTILQVPGVAVRGFRLRAERPNTFCVGIGGVSPGVLLDGLECTSNQQHTIGITVEALVVPEGEMPVVIQNCTIDTSNIGIQVLGVELSSQRPLPTRGLLLQGNQIHDAAVGIALRGTVSDVHVVANRITNCSGADIRLADLYEGSAGLLIANNSLKDLRYCLEVIEPSVAVRAVEIRNNLILAEHVPDIRFVGKDRQALSGWRIDHNWRHARPPAADSPEAREWLLPSKDTVVEKLPLLALDPRHPDFLRPVKNSPLGTGGAGGDLPSYVGALPPEGVSLWDWSKTWKARAGKHQEPSGKTGKD
jgi:hypothetical protein